jgi:hypothetical protein
MKISSYHPALTIREAEIRALANLASGTKDAMLPIVRLQAWPRTQKDSPSLVERSLSEYAEAMGNRTACLDLALPRTEDKPMVKVGAAELAHFHNPANGFEAWTTLLKNWDNFIPTIQCRTSKDNFLKQIVGLAGLNRGLAIRLRRSQSWNIEALHHLSEISLAGVPIMVILDSEQIAPTENIIVTATAIQDVALAASKLIKSGNKYFVLAASSFPAEFASIHPTNAKLEIRERQLYSLLNGSPKLVEAGVELHYGDHASVYATERPAGYRGKPRVDYPMPLHWIYHRKPAGSFQDAAEAIKNDDDWNEQLLCWGSQEIRRAAAGNMDGLNAPAPWTAIRINIHLHVQAHFGYDAINLEEEWED